MLNFVISTQDYVTSQVGNLNAVGIGMALLKQVSRWQVLDVSWLEFESDLSDADKVFSLDTLYTAHQRYIKKAVFR